MPLQKTAEKYSVILIFFYFCFLLLLLLFFWGGGGVLFEHLKQLVEMGSSFVIFNFKVV